MLRSLSLPYRWMQLWIALVWFSALLALVAPLTTHAQLGKVSPDQISVTLRAGECTTSPITVTTAPASVTYSALDVVLLIDITSSMHDQINQVRASASDIVASIRAQIPDSRLALVTVADYPGLLNLTDYPWRLDQDFTSDERIVQSALDAIELANGGDDNETYLRALDETTRLGWRGDARRLILFFGDSNPHDPDPGADGRLGTADDLSMDTVLKGLSSSNVSVLSIYTNSLVAEFYQVLAAQTKGQAFQIESANQIPSVVQELVGRSLGRPGSMTLRPNAAAERWLTWQPAAHQSIPPGEARTFELRICTPANTAPDTYQLGVVALVDSAEVGTVPITVRVPAGFVLPWWWFLPLLIPLLLLLIWALRWRQGQVTSSTGLPNRRSVVGTSGVLRSPPHKQGFVITKEQPKPESDKPEHRS